MFPDEKWDKVGNQSKRKRGGGGEEDENGLPSCVHTGCWGWGVYVFLVKGVGGPTHFKEITREMLASVFGAL